MARNNSAPSIREALNEAVEKSDPDDVSVVETEETALDAGAEPENDSSGVTEAPETPIKADSEPETPPKTELAAEHQRQQPAGREAKPPIDWDVNLKQKWKDTPPEVRNWIAGRQQQVENVLHESAEARKFAGQVVQTLEPYRAVMAAEGVQNPLQAIDGLMRITATLQMGSPQQKAQSIANLIKHYGIDIETLDSALVGSLPPPDPVQSRLEQLLEQRMAPVNQLLEQVNQANSFQQQQLYGSAYQSIEEFAADPKHEFIEDVRHDMADILERAAQRGRSLTLTQAYNLACNEHEQIGPILAQRQSPAVVAQNKRNAASSIKASGSPGSSSGTLSLRDTLAAQLGGDDRI